jgi:ribonuclease T2
MDYGLLDIYQCLRRTADQVLSRPDLCDGTYEANCDRSRVYTNISAILTAGGGPDVLSYMQKYWKDYQGDDENLWSHEWSKHGTCVSTLDTKCYTDYRAQQEVVDYFNVTTSLFATLPTYETLAAADVLPSESRTWTEEEIQAPLKKMHGAAVTLRCKGKVFNEVWYHFSVRGSVQNGEFVAVAPDGAKSSCPGTGIRYLPKRSSGTSSSATEPTSSQPVTPIPLPTSTAVPFTGKGFLQIYVKGESGSKGCLISGGSWYMSGTCAGFHVQNDVVDKSASRVGDQAQPHTFTLLSSKGPCGIIQGKFQCAKELPSQTIFSTTSNGTLSYQKQTSFYADAVPQRFEMRDISTSRGDGDSGVEVEVVWSDNASRIQAQEDL